MNNTNSIGIFDSGVGGLSVLRHIRSLLPNENLFYVADSAHVPYGNKTQEYIQQRSIMVTTFLIEQGAKAIVVACNTATAAAVSILRSTFTLPIVAIEPGVKPAVASTRSGVVGVLATTGTVRSTRYTALVEKFGKGVEIITQPCPGLVEHIEQGQLSGLDIRTLLENYTFPLIERGADTLILGCTHYPFLHPLLLEILGSDISIIDTGNAVARELHRRLDSQRLLTNSSAQGTVRFWTSGSIGEASQAISLLWQKDINIARLPKLYAEITNSLKNQNTPH